MSLTVSEEPGAGREDDPDHQREERRDREEDHPDEVGRPASRRHDAVAEEPEGDERVLAFSELPERRKRSTRAAPRPRRPSVLESVHAHPLSAIW